MRLPARRGVPLRLGRRAMPFPNVPTCRLAVADHGKAQGGAGWRCVFLLILTSFGAAPEDGPCGWVWV